MRRMILPILKKYWKLLLSALNLVSEIDNERLRLYTVQQATERFKNDALEKKEKNESLTAAERFYVERREEVKETRDSFEAFINNVAKTDKYIVKDQEEVEALMSGYMALTDKEKREYNIE